MGPWLSVTVRLSCALFRARARALFLFVCPSLSPPPSLYLSLLLFISLSLVLSFFLSFSLFSKMGKKKHYFSRNSMANIGQLPPKKQVVGAVRTNPFQKNFNKKNWHRDLYDPPAAGEWRVVQANPLTLNPSPSTHQPQIITLNPSV